MKRIAAISVVVVLVLYAVFAVWAQPPPRPEGPGAPGPGIRGPRVGAGGGARPVGPPTNGPIPGFNVPGGAPQVFRPGLTCPSAALVLPPPPVMARLGDTLQLTDEQKENLQEALRKSEQALTTLRNKAEEASRLLREAVLADNYDSKKVAELAARAEKAEADMVSAQVDTWTQIRSILTAEQAKRLREFFPTRPGISPGPGGPGPGPVGPPVPPPGPGEPGAVPPGPGPGPGPEPVNPPPGPMTE